MTHLKTLLICKFQLFTMLLSMLIIGFSGPAARAEVTITFGTYAADKPSAVVRQFKPFLRFLETELSAELGEPVRIRMNIAKQYEESIQHLVTGEVDFARFGPASYVIAKSQNPNVNIVAIESVKGKKRFNGVIAVHSDSALSTLDELNEQSFAFGDELSTIGRYLAQSALLEAGVSAANLGTFEYLGRHDLVGTAVGNGSFAAGALKESTFNKLVQKGVPIRPLTTFENVTKPWIASAEMPEAILAAMRAVMLNPKNLEAVKSIAKHGFLPGEDADYDIIRAAMDRSANF